MKKIFISGIMGTIAMSLLIVLSPMLGFPRLPVWQLLAESLGTHVAIGWGIHFAVGIILAALYVWFFHKRIRGSYVRKGFIFSLFPFLLAQGTTFLGPDAFVFTNERLLLAIASLIGHAVYGIVVAYFFRGSK